MLEVEQLNFFSDYEKKEQPKLQVLASQEADLHDSEISYQDEFITESEEHTLLAAVDTSHWSQDLQRRVQHYGYRYDYSKKGISQEHNIGPLPSWVMPLATRLKKGGIFENLPDQLIVNEYKPGQGIAPHADRDCFGPVVAAVSLGSDCMMQIYPAEKKDARNIIVLRRSLMVYRGKGRTLYRHGIQPRKSDKQNGTKICRGRRVSLTFRTILFNQL